MVGKRRNLLNGHNSNGSHNASHKYQRVDLEAGYAGIDPIKPRQRFRDLIDQTLKDNRANDMKRKLIDSIDHEALEIYRKSDESVSRNHSVRSKRC
jgi:hypothetical protein